MGDGDPIENVGDLLDFLAHVAGTVEVSDAQARTVDIGEKTQLRCQPGASDRSIAHRGDGMRYPVRRVAGCLDNAVVLPGRQEVGEVTP
jgi:hypothetical protein